MPEIHIIPPTTLELIREAEEQHALIMRVKSDLRAELSDLGTPGMDATVARVVDLIDRLIMYRTCR